MCGIAGIVGTLDPEGEDIAAMLRALAHRGPDGEGIHRESGAVLGHRRLSIIDLAGGRQPLRNAEGTIWLVCNGEIYNYVELRQKLEARGHRFVTHSDCEVIIGLYEAYGDRLLEHLRGMFAFALWDSRKPALARGAGPPRAKAVFLRRAAGSASRSGRRSRSLLALDPSLRKLNLAALDQYLALRIIAPPLTMFRDVVKLPPGHLLVLEKGGAPQVRAYWDLEFEPKHAPHERIAV